VLAECVGLAQQAPTSSYAQNWHFVVVTDQQRRAAQGELWLLPTTSTRCRRM
jgi:nitroreductase